MRTNIQRRATAPTDSAAMHMKLAKSARVGDAITYLLRADEHRTERVSVVVDDDAFGFTLADGQTVNRDPRKKTAVQLLSSSRPA